MKDIHNYHTLNPLIQKTFVSVRSYKPQEINDNLNLGRDFVSMKYNVIMKYQNKSVTIGETKKLINIHRIKPYNVK